MRSKFRHNIVLIVVILSSQLINAQADSVNLYLKSAKKAYKLGNYVSSTLDFEKALDFSNSLSSNHMNKNALKLEALKGVITVSGMGSAMEIATKYFTNYQAFIFKDLCNSPHRAVKIGLINNYIGVSYHNQQYTKAINIYKKFIKDINNCDNFRDVNIVQSTANAVLSYAELNKTSEAIKLLPLLKYYKDSLINWTTADFEKVLANVKANSGVSPSEIITHYKNAANAYEAVENYRYAFNVYETLLGDYASYMNNDELVKLVNDSKIAKEKSPYYHNEQYDNMMKQLGLILLERNQVEEENKSLKSNILTIICISLVIGIFVLFYTLKKVKEKNTIYKKLYMSEKRLKQQEEKLTNLKSNFIKNNYQISHSTKNTHNYTKLHEALVKDFPTLSYNIHLNYPDLTKREVQIIHLSLLDLTNKECAELLHLTYGSYRVAKNRLLKKMNCDNILEFNKKIKDLIV